MQKPICQGLEAAGAIRHRNTELCVWTHRHFLPSRAVVGPIL